jgi:hypothetical protein
MRMIRKINLMGVPLQVEDLLFNIDRKKQREDVLHVGRRVTFGIIAQIRPSRKRGGTKARRLQVSKLGMIPQAKMILQRLAAIIPHHAPQVHHTNDLWQEAIQVSHPLVMIVMMSVRVRESPP